MSNSESRKRAAEPAEPSTLRERVEALTSALERTERNLRLAINQKPVRDMTENLAENAAALATPDSPRSGELSDSLSLESGRPAESGECWRGPEHCAVCARSAESAPSELPEAGCSTPDCPGDPRYPAPGRSHLAACTHPRPAPLPAELSDSRERESDEPGRSQDGVTTVGDVDRDLLHVLRMVNLDPNGPGEYLMVALGPQDLEAIVRAVIAAGYRKVED